MSKKKVGYIIPHTHWDREWRYPIWKNRMLLVEFMDELIETMEKNPAYRCFIMDGQCVVIEDYLEVKPYNEERIKKQVAAGRLVIGPWYTLPDLYPIDGECLVRNMLKGTRLSNKLGGHLNIGYNSFGWGQTAQFPQIYKEFNIDFAIAAKRVSEERAPDSEFLWEAPDGTRLLTSRLGVNARANLYFTAYMDVTHGTEFNRTDGYVFDWGKAGLIIHNASIPRCHEDHFKISDNLEYHPELIKDRFTKAWKNLDATTVKDHRLLLNGCDFTSCQPELTQVIKDANKQFSDIEFIHAHIDDYIAAMKKRINEAKLKVVKGELRDGPACGCSGNALMTRPHLKMANKQAQMWILHRAEPLASMLSMMGLPYPEPWFTLAWKYVLGSHAHDSINGVTQDKTGDDTLNRLQQAIEMGQVAYEKNIGDLIKMLNLSKYSPSDVLLFVYNPTPRPLRDVLKVCVDTPQDQNVWLFSCEDSDGRPCDVQHVSRQEKKSPVNDLDSRPWPHYLDRHIAYIEPGEIPAGGYKVLKITATHTFYRQADWWPTSRESTGDELSQAPGTMENEFLKVTVNPNGTIDLFDKSLKKQFSNLLYFEDAGDVGDYWAYYPPYNDQIINTLASNARVWCEENGPLAAVFAIEHTMKIPAYGFRPDNGVRGDSKRSDELKEMVITSRLTLKKGSRRVEVKTVVTNTCEDHRLRMMLPTGIAAEWSDAAGHFCVDHRPVEPLKSKKGTFYPEIQTLPMQQFVDISDEKRGIAFMSNCFIEYEMLRDENHTLAITLFRAMRNIICTEWRSSGIFPRQKGGQSLRTFEFDWALYPHAGTWDKAGVYREAEAFNCGATAYQTSSSAKGKLPLKASLFSVQPDNLILSAFKKAHDRDTFILRFYNPSSKPVQGKVKLPARIKKAWLTNLNEERRQELKVNGDGSIAVPAGKCKIVTVEVSV
jgi:mannosylglycerate hydrolase